MSSKSKQETKNTYQYMPTPQTAEITQAQSVANNLRSQINPRIRANFAGARSDLKNSFNNPMGAYTTPAIRDATLRAGNADLAQQEAQALTEADYLANSSDFERQMNIANFTQPRLVQTGGTTTGSQSSGIAGAAIGGLANVGSAALM